MSALNKMSESRMLHHVLDGEEGPLQQEVEGVYCESCVY